MDMPPTQQHMMMNPSPPNNFKFLKIQIPLPPISLMGQDGRRERTLREVLHIWLSTYQKVRRMNEQNY